MTVWLPIAAIADRRGVSRQAVHKRVTAFERDGLLETRRAGRRVLVNVVAYDRLVADETDPAQALRNPDTPDPTLPLGEPTAKPKGDLPGVSDSDPDEDTRRSGFHAAKAAQATYSAESARLDLQERLGELASASEVDAATMEVLRRARDRLLALPATVADRCAAAEDARAVRTILDAEIRSVLDQLADDLEADARDDDHDAGAAADLAGEREAAS